MPAPPSSRHCARTSRPAHTALTAIRPTVLLLAKALCVPLASAAPLSLLPWSHVHALDDEPPKLASDPDLYLYLGVAIALVLLGGIFAGLTIAFMGQDETYLQVIATSGEGSERKHAARVLGLLNRGKHWVLVTLLLSNVITNETLPIVLDRSLGGGWPAVLSSTVLIVIFGEVAPQSVCVRYGLSIGAYCSPFVLLLMWILAPVAWPTAKLLDWLLGEEHGTMYKKAGLKTLVSLHKTLGQSETERLMDDEVTIITSVLDLKEKPVGDIMTPMQDVFIMSADTVLDERMMDTILSQGYSRVPIYAPDNQRNFIGMLLVKILITYDPEDAKRVRDFALATLPETGPHTSCLDIINFFQEGKSHMVLVSDFPGEDRGALGVVTLEDVIEELIGEEIIDESDVFVDVHKAIRRMTPAPRQHYLRQASQTRGRRGSEEVKETEPLLVKEQDTSTAGSNGAPQQTFLVRRKSSTSSDTNKAVRTNTAEMRPHLRHLGPSNAASHPRATKYTSVKIKPGVGTIPENHATSTGVDDGNVALKTTRSQSVDEPERPVTWDGHENSGVLRSAGKDASDGAAALRAGYGTMSSSGELPRVQTSDSFDQEKTGSSPQMMSAGEASKVAEQKALDPSAPLSASAQKSEGSKNFLRVPVPGKVVVGEGGEEIDQVGDLSGPPSRAGSKSRRGVRSGSITETEVDVGGGMKKVVLETTSSSSSEEGAEDGDDTATEDEKGGGGVNGDKSSEGGGSLKGMGLFGRRDSTKDAKKKKGEKRKEDGGGDKSG